MRIGIVVDNEFNQDIRVRNEALALQKDGHEVFILCFDFGSQYGKEYQGLKIYRWKLNKKIQEYFICTIPLYQPIFLFMGKKD